MTLLFYHANGFKATYIFETCLETLSNFTLNESYDREEELSECHYKVILQQ